MRGGVLTVAAIAGAMLFVVTTGAASAKSDKLTCKGNQSQSNIDGTSCEASTSGGGTKAKAVASKTGVAIAESASGGNATANATKGAEADSETVAGTSSATASGDMAVGNTEIDGGGVGTADATGANSKANATIGAPGGGIVQATANAGGQATANLAAGGGGNAIASAKSQSTANANVTIETGGTAVARSSGTGAIAQSIVSENCVVDTSAKGAGSSAMGTCQKQGSKVTVEATLGSIAIGSDTSGPTCTPMNGGKAKVTSPKGNC